ncbi:response regulator transcription factor [Dactylosporangium aurantiacum]|uniref:Response regulator transcription factor n=1 Tax=Dactylosporangium aurantiacum TaxID=35754 RepID=A0A9Q9IHU0_9ACTN|nr:response regulator transcription factor [Dactylosporangium aurantiacum]MDG6106092.1 response regulator transcription factor [Dactylosporangium aurantiacum]UWZ55866.1 response regulator transcription factor [Dactylosporangium aurantiacum]
MTVRVVLAEDNLLAREGLRSILDRAPQLTVIAVVDAYDDLLAAVDEHRPDVVLTDIRMPPTSTDEGVRAAARFRRTHPSMGVVVISQYDDPEFALALLEDGSRARAYLLKERMSDPAQLVSAVVEVSRGGSVVDPKVVDALVRGRGTRSPLALLTPREHDVLAQMATGKDNAAIAAALVLTVRAVEKHINGIFAKLGLAEEREVHKRVKAVLLHLAAG